jgi:hypothetical protein
MISEWRNAPFDEIETDKISKLSEEYSMRASKCKKRMTDSTAVKRFVHLVTEF